MPPESRTRRTWLRGSSRQTIGTSATLYPRRRASHSTSASKPNRSRRCRPNSSRATDRRNALNPHWLSLIPGSSKSETSPLKVRPASPRSQGCRTRMSDPATRRDPMATSAPPSRAARSFATSSIGVERSASVNRTCAWRATSMPRRTLPPLPVFRGLRSTDTRPDARPSSVATSLSVDAPVVDDDDLRGLGEAPRVLDQPGERAGQSTRLVVRGHDDRETRRGGLRRAQRLWLTGILLGYRRRSEGHGTVIMRGRHRWVRETWPIAGLVALATLKLWRSRRRSPGRDCTWAATSDSRSSRTSTIC